MASKLYSAIIATATPFVPSKLMPLWNHAAGPKTVFFWAPVFKWGLVIAGLNDLRRPADQLSVGQCGSLAVNVFVALTQLVQLYRAFTFQKKVEAISALPEDEKMSPAIASPLIKK